MESRCGALGAGLVLGDVHNVVRCGVRAAVLAYAHVDVRGAARGVALGAVPACDRAFDYYDLALFFLAFLTLD